MKKLILLTMVCSALFLTACHTDSKPEQEESLEPQTELLAEPSPVLESERVAQDFIYTISGDDRDDEEYTIKEGKLVFPRGMVTQVRGSTTGTPERDFVISEKEVGDIISMIERDSIVVDTMPIPKSPGEVIPSDVDWEEGFGCLDITIQTASGKENGIYLYFSDRSFVSGGPLYGEGMSVDITSPDLAQKLRDIVEYKRVDLKMLDRAVSATCTSVVNGNSLTLMGGDLKQLVAGIQEAEKVYATKRAEAVSVEFLLDDGEVIRSLFTGTGYYTIGVEAELYEMTEESAKPFLNAFLENGMPLFARDEAYPIVSLDCNYVMQEYYTDDSERDEDFFLSYAGAAYYDSIIRMGGAQRNRQNIVIKDEKMILPEGKVVNITVNGGDKEGTLAIETEDSANEFIGMLESSKVSERDILSINSDEVNIVILNTSGEYSLILLSLSDDGMVNCRILSENKQDNAMNFQIESKQLYELLSNLV